VKVLHVINTLAVGGAECHLLTLCKQLRGYGIETVVAFGRESIGDSRSLRRDFEECGIRTIRAGLERRYDPSFPIRVLQIATAERPDILHSHLPRADLVAAVATRLTRPRPWVVSVHNIHDAEATWSGEYLMPLVRRLWRRADRVIAISGAVRDWLVREQAIGPGRIRVVHYGIDVERFAPVRSQLRRAWGIADEPVVGAIGRLEPRKGHEYLIDAMASIRRRLPGAVLVIAGHDPRNHRGALERMISHHKLERSVRLIGFQQDIPGFLAAVDVFAFASVAEGFGQVVVEAMAAAKPVVATKIAPLTEIVADGETGILVKARDPEGFAEAIVRVLKDPEEALRMGEGGRTRARELFSADTMAARTVGIYRELLAGPRAA
jgi:glycosyltransferase involved in cell wall biosynthesis